MCHPNDEPVGRNRTHREQPPHQRRVDRRALGRLLGTPTARGRRRLRGWRWRRGHRRMNLRPGRATGASLGSVSRRRVLQLPQAVGVRSLRGAHGIEFPRGEQSSDGHRSRIGKLEHADARRIQFHCGVERLGEFDPGGHRVDVRRGPEPRRRGVVREGVQRDIAGSVERHENRVERLAPFSSIAAYTM